MPHLHPEHNPDPSNVLEPGQLAAATAQPTPRAQLTPATYTALWTLRIFAVIVTLMVIYTFINQLD